LKFLFLDTDVVIDLLADRQPHSAAVAQLFDMAEKGALRLYISALSYSNIYYILKKASTHQTLKAILQDLEALTETLPVTKAIIAAALHSDFKDFEDSIQYHTALSSKKTDAIITRNVKDYKLSELTVLTPEEALSVLSNAKKQ
jgi:predicted nucleic acid-binding protein